jgi:hypothetical protein
MNIQRADKVIELTPKLKGQGMNCAVISDRKATRRLKPLQEQALRMYAIGKYDWDEARVAAGVKSKAEWSLILNSQAGQAVVSEVRGILEDKFQAQFSKVVDVLGQGLDHPDPQVALASASLWLKTNRGSKVEVKITAEDLVAQLMGQR